MSCSCVTIKYSYICDVFNTNSEYHEETDSKRRRDIILFLV